MLHFPSILGNHLDRPVLHAVEPQPTPADVHPTNLIASRVPQGPTAELIQLAACGRRCDGVARGQACPQACHGGEKQIGSIVFDWAEFVGENIASVALGGDPQLLEHVPLRVRILVNTRNALPDESPRVLACHLAAPPMPPPPPPLPPPMRLRPPPPLPHHGLPRPPPRCSPPGPPPTHKVHLGGFMVGNNAGKEVGIYWAQHGGAQPQGAPSRVGDTS